MRVKKTDRERREWLLETEYGFGIWCSVWYSTLHFNVFYVSSPVLNAHMGYEA